MRLNQNEAICLALSFSSNKTINSQLKLNKMIARLNLFMIPIDIDFTLNKNGSFSIELQNLESNEFFTINPYEIEGRQIPKYYIKPNGERLADDVIKQKLSKILTLKDLEELKEEIYRLSNLTSQKIRDDEHCRLRVDVDDRYKLIERINNVAVDFYDLNEEIKKIQINKVIDITLSALIEYCYYLAKYLQEVRFKNVGNEYYDFGENMMSYYFLRNLKEIIPKLKEQIKLADKNGVFINRCYQYFVNGARDIYEFSLDNPKLHQLITN